ncbi:hypothetical protein BDV26DRAFT_286915 [Aspergillus bertholletiae]|uniref:Uncharacterized protein n=1 Tax=Aspergillus bertholletiae TaxID=1226010 RepID=A0A5N7AMZ3_9EURO|nr:hypothetical protein BDV26DRAFT_286915 [Aspergillus bertholletiae]
MLSDISLPPLPINHIKFLEYIKSQPTTPIEKLIETYEDYDSVLREIFAQMPSHELLSENLLNVVPLYDNHGWADVRVRARDIASESDSLKRSPAVVSTFREFEANFDNVVVAGSAVVIPLLPVPEEFRGSRQRLRGFYHEKFTPAYDVDLSLYGLTEDQAVDKIRQIERSIRDSICHETVTVRTKNAIMIASQHPIRYVQIVLRIYKSISEILTGFDVDCSCAAYDGQNVYLASYITKTNRINLSRRSPSYESRLSKYARRGFEIFYPQLDLSRINPVGTNDCA